jgi:fumarate reductase (CoM/CoB) subunit A
MKTFRHNLDILIVGSGAAGLKAALTLKENKPDLKIGISEKGKIGKAGTTANAVSDRMAFHATLPYTPPSGKNNIGYHALDIFRIGKFVSDYPLAKILAEESEQAVKYLDKTGVPFIKDKKRNFTQFLTDGSVYPRACFTGPLTARHIETSLLKKLKNYDYTIYDNCMILDLYIRHKKLLGALGMDRENNIHIFNTPFVILATGGAGGIFKNSCFPDGMTGDGYGIALRAGLSLVNMEFIQLGTCIEKLKIACSGSFMRAVPRIVDEKNQEILTDFYRSPEKMFEIIFRKGASWPVSYEEESKIIDIITYRRERIYLDYTKNHSLWNSENIPSSVKKWYKDKNIDIRNTVPAERLKMINCDIFRMLKKRGIDPSTEKIKVFEAAQHFQGGIKIGRWGQTSAEGVFACGECAGGQHGANRPGGNALLDTQVFGKRTAEKILESIKGKKGKPCIAFDVPVPRAPALSEKEYKKLGEEIKNKMNKYVSVIREEKKLSAVYSDFQKIKNSGVFPGISKAAYETYNILLTSMAVIKSCLLRKESRGPHLFWENKKLKESDSAFDYKYVRTRLLNSGMKAKLEDVERE